MRSKADNRSNTESRPDTASAPEGRGKASRGKPASHSFPGDGREAPVRRRRFVALWFPDWAIDLLRRRRPSAIPDKEPLVLVLSGRRGIEITAVNARAAAGGIRVGQALADARALLPGLRSRAATPEADAAALDALALWCGRFGPRRNVHGTDGIWIEVTGAAHLFGGEEGMMRAIRRQIGGFGFNVRTGLADTFAAADALARFADSGSGEAGAIAAAGGGASQLARLPVEALRLDAETVRLLRRLGLKHIGQLWALPRASLQMRFREACRAGRRLKGPRDAAVPAAAVLLRLDQLSGRVNEPLPARCEPPVLSVRRSWSDPLLTGEGIAAETALLCDRLVSRLADQGLGCRRVRLTLYRTDGTVAELETGTSFVCRDGRHLAGLLGERFAAVDAGFGIDVMVLEALQAGSLDVSQQVLGMPGEHTWGGQTAAAGDARALGQLVDRLANRFGDRRVFFLRPAGSHIPERAERLCPARASLGASPAGKGSGGGGRGSAGGRIGGAVRANRKTGAGPSLSPASPGPGAVPGPSDTSRSRPLRPLFLLALPEPADVVEDRHGRPVRLLWRRVAQRIVRAEGPERIAPEWWRAIGRRQAGSGEACGQPDGAFESRDYYRVEVAGGVRYWIFKAGSACSGEGLNDSSKDAFASAPSRWFVHGLHGQAFHGEEVDEQGAVAPAPVDAGEVYAPPHAGEEP